MIMWRFNTHLNDMVMDMELSNQNKKNEMLLWIELAATSTNLNESHSDFSALL